MSSLSIVSAEAGHKSRYFDTWSTPIGTFSLAVEDGGAVIATAFGDERALRERLGGSDLLRDGARVAAARRQADEYFEGGRRAFTVPLAASGSDFQHRVWAALGAIPYGETRSYGELAREIGSSARAVGRANATNPICVIVPCHRVIGADGSLTGFAFGEETKSRLLDHERAL